MWAKIVPVLLNWIKDNIIVPAFYAIRDYFTLKKEKTAAEKAAEDLKNAKSKNDIDSSVDRMP